MLSEMKTVERIRARELRQVEGRSVQEIARIVGVSRSSVSLWVRDIEMTPEQHAALFARNPAYNRQRVGAEAKIVKYRAIRAQSQEDGRAIARRGDAFHVAGCMLYWAEGGKKRNVAHLSNSDPEVVRFFVRFVRRYFDVRDDGFRVTCNLFADHLERQSEIERFWLETLSLSESSLCKSIVNVYSKYSQKKRMNMLPYGTCRVSIYQTHIVQHIYGAIQEYGGFDRPEWLD